MSTPGEMPNPLDPNEKGRDPNDPEKRADRSDTGGSTGDDGEYDQEEREEGGTEVSGRGHPDGPDDGGVDGGG